MNYIKKIKAAIKQQATLVAFWASAEISIDKVNAYFGEIKAGIQGKDSADPEVYNQVVLPRVKKIKKELEYALEFINQELEGKEGEESLQDLEETKSTKQMLEKYKNIKK